MSDLMRDGLEEAAAQFQMETRVSPMNVFASLVLGSPEEKPFCRWLHELPKPAGLLCPLGHPTSFLALVCRREHLSVPEEIALLAGNPEPEVCMLARPEISHVQANDWQTGYEAARLLDMQLQGREPKASVVKIPPLRIEQAASTSVLAIGGLRLRQGVQFIRAHACGPIGVDQVARHCGLPRRRLEQQMQKVLGCTVHQEITRVRIARAKQLLRGSNKPLVEIALECGLEWSSSLCKIFSREVGVSPGQYRKNILAALRSGGTSPSL
jgi:LacI family transcriptional regulator